MIQLIGFLIAFNSFIITFWWVATGHSNKAAVITLCLITVFFSIFLIIKDRATEITIKGIGSIKAATDQAVLDAKQIKDIRERMEAQSATVEVVAKHASEAKKLSEEAKDLSAEAKSLSKDLEQKNEVADKKLQDIDESIKKSTGILSELQSLSKFTSTVIEAQDNNRKAFDQINIWAKDETNLFSSRAQQAYNTIMDEHSKPYFMSGTTVPWQDGVDPTKLTLQNLRGIYNSAPIYLKPALIEYIIYGRKMILIKKTECNFLLI